MCTYINFFRMSLHYIALAAIVKVHIRIGGPKIARDEQVCAPQKLYRKYQ